MRDNRRVKMLGRLLPLLVSCALTSCIVQIEGVGTGIKRLTAEERSLITSFPLGEGVRLSPDSAYKVNATQLRRYVAGKEKVVVYQCKPTCPDKECITPDAAERICRAYGYELCLLYETYDYLKPQYMLPDVPTFVVDNAYYGSKITFTYLARFDRDLTGEKYPGRFMRFVDGEYVGGFQSCEEAVGK